MKKVLLRVAADICLIISTCMAIGVGIRYIIWYNNPSDSFAVMGYTAAIFTAIAGLITLIEFILDFFIKAKDKKSFCEAAVAYLTGILLISCAFTPIIPSVFVGLSVTAGILDVLAGSLFLINFNSEKSLNSNDNNNLNHGTVKQIKLLERLYKKGILNNEEYILKRELIIGNSTDAMQTEQVTQIFKRKKPLIISIILSAVVAVYCIVALPVIKSVYNSKIYNYVLNTISSYSKEYLDSYLDYLPDSYKDTNSIKNTYNNVYYYLYNNDIGLRRYVELNKIQWLDYRWNFERIFDNISWYDIYNVKWEGETISLNNSNSGNASGVTQLTGIAYIEFNNQGDTTTFGTNLPNKKESGKSYYYYTEYKSNGRIIGYENQNDSTDRFDAFSISNIRYNSLTNIFSMNVYCYSNNKTYVLTYEYSY